MGVSVRPFSPSPHKVGLSITLYYAMEHDVGVDIVSYKSALLMYRYSLAHMCLQGNEAQHEGHLADKGKKKIHVMHFVRYIYAVPD